MKKILKIIKREFLTKVITRGFLIATILGPVLIIGIMLLPAYFMTVSSETPVTIGLVDQASDFKEKLDDIFSDTLKSGAQRISFVTIFPMEYNAESEKYKKLLEEGTLNAILIIPQDILEFPSVTYIARTVSDLELMQRLKNGLSIVINREQLRRAGLDPDQINKMTRDVSIQSIKIERGEEKERGFDQEYMSALIFLVILYMTIIVYGSSIMRSVIEEKTSRIIEVLLSSTNSFQLMMGKLLGVGSVGLVQYVIWGVMALLAFMIATTSIPGISDYISVSPSLIFYFILFFIIGYFTFSTLYAAVGALCSDMQDAQSLSTPVTLLVVLPFMISFMVIRDPTTDIARILSLVPFFTPLIMFLRILLIHPPAWEIGLSIFINVLTIVGIIWLAGRIYRVGILMYGKRPTIPEILKWIQYR